MRKLQNRSIFPICLLRLFRCNVFWWIYSVYLWCLRMACAHLRIFLIIMCIRDCVKLLWSVFQMRQMVCVCVCVCVGLGV